MLWRWVAPSAARMMGASRLPPWGAVGNEVWARREEDVKETWDAVKKMRAGDDHLKAASV